MDSLKNVPVSFSNSPSGTTGSGRYSTPRNATGVNWMLIRRFMEILTLLLIINGTDADVFHSREYL
jgi:hypothetical protein